MYVNYPKESLFRVVDGVIKVTVAEPAAEKAPEAPVAEGNTTVESYSWISLSDGSELTAGDKFEAGKSYRLKVTLKPNKGYKFPYAGRKDVEINGQTTIKEDYDSKDTDKFTCWRAFTVPEATTYTVAFTDVPETAWYADAVKWAVKNNITAGTSATTFSPEKTCTRAEIVQFLYNQAKKPAVTLTNRFSDVPQNAWYASAVSWAVEKNVTSGVDGTHFGPDGSCTRAEIVQFLYNQNQNG